MALSESFKAGHHVWHYRKWGTGKHLILCFHGFGQKPEDWMPIVDALGDTFSFACFYLPNHGSDKGRRHRFSKEELVDFWKQAAIQFETNDFSLMGNSIGARLALILHQEASFPIKNLVLIAPDGVKDSWVYRLSTRTSVGNAIFGFLCDNPPFLMMWIKLANAFGIIHQSVYRFVDSQLNSKDKCKRVYNTWTALSLKPAKIQMRSEKLVGDKTNTLLIFGAKDRVIPVSHGRWFKKNAPCELLILDKGHFILGQEILITTLQRQVEKGFITV